ncbi:MAG: HNH endonuclease signature motif containing protein [Thermaerobacter sp.]|nr:HNH endonuclease signature motif containing protein [Thermaerobacter sp.]
MVDEQYEYSVRKAAMDWLHMQNPSGSRLLRYEDVASFTFEGRRIPLMPTQQGIRKPAHMSAALSIRTTFTPPGEAPPYEDAMGKDGLPRYKYRGTDPQHHENVALRTALEYRLPLIWFVGAQSGLYVPVYPVWIVGEEKSELQFVLAFDRSDVLLASDDTDRRHYVERVTKERLHQTVFRAQVLQAYEQSCAICRLRHVSLLEAAHILPDGHPRGLPVVPNGLSLCKMHHAAYDQNLLGIRPDFVVEVRADVLREHDGPMLLHGLQEMDGVPLLVPASRSARPDPSRLEERYKEFLQAG